MTFLQPFILILDRFVRNKLCHFMVLITLISCYKVDYEISATIIESKYIAGSRFVSDSRSVTEYKILIENSTKTPILINWFQNKIYDKTIEDALFMYSIVGLSYSIIQPKTTDTIIIRRLDRPFSKVVESDTNYLRSDLLFTDTISDPYKYLSHSEMPKIVKLENLEIVKELFIENKTSRN